MSYELRDRWLNGGKSKFNKRVYKYHWPCSTLNSTKLSKLTTTWYHQIACGRGRFNDRMSLFDHTVSPNCRFGCYSTETVDHIFTTCPALQHERDTLRNHCTSLDLRHDLTSLFTDQRLQLYVERFLLKIISSPWTPVTQSHLVCDPYPELWWYWLINYLILWIT